jgi:hypothetical protein
VVRKVRLIFLIESLNPLEKKKLMMNLPIKTINPKFKKTTFSTGSRTTTKEEENEDLIEVEEMITEDIMMTTIISLGQQDKVIMKA